MEQVSERLRSLQSALTPFQCFFFNKNSTKNQRFRCHTGCTCTEESTQEKKNTPQITSHKKKKDGAQKMYRNSNDVRGLYGLCMRIF